MRRILETCKTVDEVEHMLDAPFAFQQFFFFVDAQGNGLIVEHGGVQYDVLKGRRLIHTNHALTSTMSQFDGYREPGFDDKVKSIPRFETIEAAVAKWDLDKPTDTAAAIETLLRKTEPVFRPKGTVWSIICDLKNDVWELVWDDGRINLFETLLKDIESTRVKIQGKGRDGVATPLSPFLQTVLFIIIVLIIVAAIAAALRRQRLARSATI